MKIFNADLMYKQALISGIHRKYQFSPKVEDLSSVLAPIELKSLLREVPSSFYEVGLNASSLFENVKKALYRINLHVHTNKSDGSMTPSEYLEQSVKYSDKVAKKTFDKYPPYISAITDHNNFEASQEVIAMIADEPKKYKNFRFAAGCEFMFLDESSGFKFPAFEVLGLSINPFCEELLAKLGKFNSINIIDKIKEFGSVLSYAHPIRHCQGNGLTQKFADYLKQIGVDGVESNYQYVGFNYTPELKAQIEEIRLITENNEFYKTGGTDTHGGNIFHTRVQGILDTLI